MSLATPSLSLLRLNPSLAISTEGPCPPASTHYSLTCFTPKRLRHWHPSSWRNSRRVSRFARAPRPNGNNMEGTLMILEVHLGLRDEGEEEVRQKFAGGSQGASAAPTS
ncbi:hypothetical protein BCR35DRAFT_303288 [Leucosporidium creatinivorum]|uniref:Uncharacterized protein n=1 Tax=Leucosporidium creatinivorum TaxID=106004 RepID=A0A1Y2FJP3_9BASI|nr:hypothetical protein BCR35DRAFT_303288 [Leucosporidium creatinivorum]